MESASFEILEVCPFGDLRAVWVASESLGFVGRIWLNAKTGRLVRFYRAGEPYDELVPDSRAEVLAQSVIVSLRE